MKLAYESKTIENIINALDRLNAPGIANAEIITYIIQEIKRNEPLEGGGGDGDIK